MQRSEQLNELAKALAEAQADMKAAEMNSKNPFLKSSYADLGSIIEAIRPAIGKHGLAFAQAPAFDGQTVTVETIIMHASGQFLTSEISLSIEGEKGLSLAQVMGKAITYLRRYGLSAMFGVYADKDEDGNGTGEDSEKHVSERPATTPAASSGPVPTCPKCHGAMWDNREKKTNPNAPDFKCKNKECGGAIWPLKNGTGNTAPSATEDTIDPAEPITPEQIKKIHTIAGKLYKSPDEVTKYRTWMKKQYNVASSKELTKVQAIEVISALEAVELEAQLVA